MKHPVDVHVGKRVRHRRWMVGMTQQQLGDIVGIKFQQIQKYETGMNRISASRLWDIAQALGVSISFFFEGFGDEETPNERRTASRTAATCSPTRRRSSWCAPTTRSRRRSAAGSSTWPASSATWPDQPALDGVRGFADTPAGGSGRRGGAKRWRCRPRSRRRCGEPPRISPTSPPRAACRCSAAPGWRRRARRPAGFDPVTEADREAERAMRALLAARRPADGILGEEFPATEGTSGLTWVIDPIDGTRAFWSGATTWGTLIGLDAGDGPLLGVIDQPYTGERFMGGLGRAEMTRGAERRPLAVRACAGLADAVLYTTYPGGRQPRRARRLRGGPRPGADDPLRLRLLRLRAARPRPGRPRRSRPGCRPTTSRGRRR